MPATEISQRVTCFMWFWCLWKQCYVRWWLWRGRPN